MFLLRVFPYRARERGKVKNLGLEADGGTGKQRREGIRDGVGKRGRTRGRWTDLEEWLEKQGGTS